MLRGKSLTAASGWKPGTVRLCDWPETGPWSRWMTGHQPECLRKRRWLDVRKRCRAKEFNIPICVCGRVRAIAIYLHSGTLVRQRSWWKQPGSTDPCSVSLSSSSFHPWNNCQRTEDEMREESKQDECIKTRTIFKGSASKTCVSRTPTQDGKAKKTAMNLSLVSECMNNYKYYINFLSFFSGPFSKAAKAACKRGLCTSGAWKPQERASKAKCLIGTRAHAV